MKILHSWFEKAFRGRPVVVVSGLPRSGTSMLMQMLAAGGHQIATDGRREQDDDNPRGYYELEKVKELESNADRSWLKDCRGKAVKIISFILRRLPDRCAYRVVFIERDLDEVLLSQRKMLRRRGEEQSEGDDSRLREDFKRHLKEVKMLLERRGNMEALYVNYASILVDPAAAAGMIADFVGCDLDREAMAGAVTGSLYRSRGSSP